MRRVFESGRRKALVMLALGALMVTVLFTGSSIGAVEDAAVDNTPDDIVQGDDLIVEGSVCASDADLCANAEDFVVAGFNTEFKAKDDSQPAIGFLETIGGAAWAVGISIEDGVGFSSSPGIFPMQVLSGANDNTLIVAPSSRVGIGTAAPDASLEVTGSNGNAGETRHLHMSCRRRG